jgi:hypothetical protein
MKYFDSQHIGKLYSIMTLIGSALNFLQYPAYILLTKYASGRVFYFDLVLCLLSFVNMFVTQHFLGRAVAPVEA